METKTAPIHCHYIEIEVRGAPIKISYARAGQEEPTTVIFPGLSGSGIPPFIGNVGPLAEKIGSRVMALDMPPINGLRPSLELGTKILSECLTEIAGLDPVNLIGYSAGGTISLNFALQHPKRVNKLVLVASAGLGQEIYKGFRLMSLPILGDILARLRIRPTEKSVEKFLKILFHDPEKIPKDLALVLLEQRLSWGFKKWRRWYLETLRQGVNFKGQKINLLEKIPELTIPALLIGGENDQIIPPEHIGRAWDLSYKKWLKDPSRNRVEFFKNCGHWPQMECQDEFNQVVANFLSGY